MAGQRVALPMQNPGMMGNLAHTMLPSPGEYPGTFAPQYDTRVAPYQGQPETAQTWDLAHASFAENIGNLINETIMTTEGWWFKFAPIQIIKSGLQEWSTISTRLDAFDPAAESTAPRLITIQREKHAARMGRFNLGFKVLHDNLLTPEGELEFRLKLNKLRSALIVTQKLCVGGALIENKMYWREQERIMETFYTIGDALKGQKSRFGMLSKDPQAIQKLWAELPMMLKGNIHKPNFDMLIVPEGTMAAYYYGPQARYHTDASLRGEKAVQDNLVFNMKQFDGVIKGVTIYEDEKFQVSNLSQGEINAFGRRAVLGQYAVLQYNDAGPPGICSTEGEPTIEIVTMPRDDWTRISMRDCIMNCPRFSRDDGTITDFTETFLESWGAIRDRWGGDPDSEHMIDPWVVPYRREADGRYEDVTLAVAEYIGEQHTGYRNAMFDVNLGLCGKKEIGLTSLEEEQLRNLFNTANFLYKPPRDFNGNSVNQLEAVIADAFTGAEPGDEWGGYTIARPLEHVAYGWGDIFMVMSLLSQPDKIGAGIPVDLKDKLSYGICKDALLKIWDAVKRMFPDLALNDAAQVPIHRKVESGMGRAQRDDRNAMIAVMRGMYERVKLPMFRVAAGDMPPAVAFGAEVWDFVKRHGGGGVQGSIFASPEVRNQGADNRADAVVRMRAAINALPDGGARVEKGFGRVIVGFADPDPAPTLNEFIADQYQKTENAFGDDPDAEWLPDVVGEDERRAAHKNRYTNRFVGIINGVLKLSDVVGQQQADWRPTQARLTQPMLDAFALQGEEYVSVDAYPEDALQYIQVDARTANWVATRFTFDPSAYGPAGLGLNSEALDVGAAARDADSLRDAIGLVTTKQGDIMTARGEVTRAKNALDIAVADARPGALVTFQDAVNTLGTREGELPALQLAVVQERAKPLATAAIQRTPADPYVPTRPMVPVADGGPRGQVFNNPGYARARYGQTFNANAPKDVEMARVGKGGYGAQHTQFISPGVASQVGGPFLRLIPMQAVREGAENDQGVAEREFMSERQAIIKHHLSHDPVARLMAFCFILSKPTQRAMLALLDHNLPVPMNFLIAAPFINIHTEAIVFAEGGSQTAQTGMNLLDINISQDAAHKEWLVNATVHTGAKITQAENVFILEDAKLAGYESGLELQWFTSLADVGDNFDISRMKKSLFCMDVGTTFTRDVAEGQGNPMTLFGGRPQQEFYPFEFKNQRAVFDKEKPDFDSYFAYASYWGFEKANLGRSAADRTYRDLREADFNPGACYSTRVRTYNSQQGVFLKTHRGSGHLDDIDLPMRDILDGKVRYTDLHKTSHVS
jgi:hypothetical protein